MAQTLEQRRAQNAWDCAKSCSRDYANLAKSLPALIMTSGLMQVLAFLHQKKQKWHGELGDHLRNWLHRRFPQEVPDAGFMPFMDSLLKADPQAYREITAEAHAWLRWLRQMAAAAQTGSDAR